MIIHKAPEFQPVLEVRDLSVSFDQYARGLQKITLRPVTGLSLTVRPGEVLAVVGGSGAGKSLLAHAILGILPGNARVTGTMRYADDDLTPERQVALRGRDIALVPQSVSFLSPLWRVGGQVRSAAPDGNAPAAQRAVFARYRLAPEVERLYPFQLSGGMARRVLVSTATISGAALIIADEPTPGLDPAAVAEALGHLRELAGEGRAVMLITHDIEGALTVADRVAVLYAGATVEIAAAADFAGDGRALRHPYSSALWRALPQNGFVVTPGAQPTPDQLPPGCLYAPRCSGSTPDCTAARPEFRALRGGMVRCFHAA
jgi:peptide/nickel transport system ATP-binding protein